jgi:hypothetical protein
MPKMFICGGETYEAGDRHGYGYTIGLPVILNDLPKTVSVEGHTLFLKNSFHASLVCIDRIAKQQGVSAENFSKNVTDDFCEFVRIHPIQLIPSPVNH